jgi:transposase
MEAIFVGIDVSKDRLDVHVRPSGEVFVVTRDGEGLEELVDRLRVLSFSLIAVEATGGFETIVAAALGGPAHPHAVRRRNRQGAILSPCGPPARNSLSCHPRPSGDSRESRDP